MRQQHSLRVWLHSAQLEVSSSASPLFCAAEVERFGRERTREAPTASSNGSGVSVVSWDQELEFVVGPTDQAQHLRLAIYRSTEAGRGREYVAAGSLGLSPLLEGSSGGSERRQQQVSVPVVNEVGKHAGEVSCTLSVTTPPSEAQAQAAAAAHPGSAQAVQLGR